MDPDANPYQNLQWLLGCQKIIFFILFLIKWKKLKSFKILRICLMIKMNFLARKFLCKKFFGNHYFSPLNTFMRNGKDPEPDPHPYPYLWLTDPDADLGGPNTYGFYEPDLDDDPDPEHCRKVEINCLCQFHTFNRHLQSLSLIFFGVTLACTGGDFTCYPGSAILRFFPLPLSPTTGTSMWKCPFRTICPFFIFSFILKLFFFLSPHR
jgi:hypothetical protein